MIRNYLIIMGTVCTIFFLSLCIPLYNNASDCYKHVVVKLSAKSKYSIITPKNGQRIHLFAIKLGIEPIIPNRTYSHCSIAFLHNKRIDQLAEKLDSNNNYTIDLEESFKIY